MDIERAQRVAETAVTIPSIRMIGMHMHIGSQITTTEPYAGAVAKGVELDRPVAQDSVIQSRGTTWEVVMESTIKGREAQPVEEFARVIVPGIKAANCRLAIEPGRVIVGNAGILVSRVLYTKQSGEKRFLIQDAAMNDLIRPALYESFHRIWPVAASRRDAIGTGRSDDTAVTGTRALGCRGPGMRER